MDLRGAVKKLTFLAVMSAKEGGGGKTLVRRKYKGLLVKIKMLGMF